MLNDGIRRLEGGLELGVAVGSTMIGFESGVSTAIAMDLEVERKILGQESGIPDYMQSRLIFAALSYCSYRFPSPTLLLVTLITPTHADVAVDLPLADLVILAE